MKPEVGLQPLPGYHLVQPLGKGGFGEVWEAEGPHQVRVAMKFLDCRSRPTSTIASEVKILRALTKIRHPNLIHLLGVHALDRFLILIMERADGNLLDLHNAYRQQTGGHVPPDHALELLEQAALALDFINFTRFPELSMERGLQHCDIKPSNLLLVGNRLKIGDFGLSASTGSITHGGGWKGTPPFAAPELYNGAGVPGTDQYALAITFCDLVMADRVFWKGASEISSHHSPIDFTKVRGTEVPVFQRALHPYPSSRYPNCMAFIEALRKAASIPRTSAHVRIYPRGLRGSLNKTSSGSMRAVKSSSFKTG